MKAKDIKVFTVGFDLTDSHTLGLLPTFADDGQHSASTDIDNGLKVVLGAISPNRSKKT